MNISETTEAVKDITSKVAKTSENASHASELVASAKIDAEQSRVSVGNAIDAMNSIEETSQQISQIIGVIDEIAFQTNLLALNAGVEAARAGEAGRGFAVVATEVRELASRTADEAKLIKDLVTESENKVDRGSALVTETGEAFERIMTRVMEIDEAVNNIASSTREQTADLNQVDTTIGQMDQHRQRNVAMVEQTTTATRTLTSQSDELVRLVAKFQVAGSGKARETGTPTPSEQAA